MPLAIGDAERSGRPGTHTMRAAVLVEPGKVEVCHVPKPEPVAGEALVRIEGCGVCASNVPPFEGRDWFSYPMAPGALGHEGWGIIESLPSGGQDGLSPGDRVAFIGSQSYAQFEAVPVSALVKLPASLDGMPFPGEPLGCAINIFKRAAVRKGDRVAIVGIGFLGALLVQLCKNAGASVIALARKDFALDLARSLGADEAVRMDDHAQVIAEVRRLTGPGTGDDDFTGYREGELCDVVIECTGKQWPLDLAAELTRVRGRLVVAGFHQDGMRSFNGTLWNWRGIDVINAHERDPLIYKRGVEKAIRAVEDGMLDPTPLYTHRFGLNSLGEALAMTSERPEGFMKALIEVAN